MGLRSRIGVVLAVWTMAFCSAWDAAAAGGEPSQGGVRVWLPPPAPNSEGLPSVAAVPSEDRLATKQGMTKIAADPGTETRFPPVLASAHVLAAIDGYRGSRVVVYTQDGGRETRRGEVSFGPAVKARYHLVRDDQKKSVGVEVSSLENQVISTVYLSPDGILEVRPPTQAGDAKAADAKEAAIERHAVRQAVEVRHPPLAHGHGPGLLGSKAGRHWALPPAADRWYLPSLNLFVGLVEGDDSMMVCAWPTGHQVPSLRLSGTGSDRRIDGFSLQPAGGSFYLTFLAKPGIWHAEPLKPDYLEKETVIDWKRPFDAKWIGRFYINSEEVDYPFYFRYDRCEMWGRMIRSWFTWPVWFEDDETVVHFEKRFSPQDEMLIYYLEKHPDYPTHVAILSPVEVMQKALGDTGGGPALGPRRGRAADGDSARPLRLRDDRHAAKVLRPRPRSRGASRRRPLRRQRHDVHHQHARPG